MINSPLIRPYFLGGAALGGAPLGSHDESKMYKWDVRIMMMSNKVKVGSRRSHISSYSSGTCVFAQLALNLYFLLCL